MILEENKITHATEHARMMEEKFHDASVDLAILMTGVGGWIMFYALWDYLGRPFPNAYMVQVVNFLGVFLFVLALRHTSFTLKDLGLLTDQPKKVFIQTFILCTISLGILISIKIAAQLYNPTLFQLESGFIDISRLDSYQIIYAFTAFIQEFIARSVLQSNLKRIAATKHKAAYSIICASVIFAVLHIMYGFWFMVGAAVLGAVLGVIYEKQNTIFGVWFLHWFLGVSANVLGIINH